MSSSVILMDSFIASICKFRVLDLSENIVQICIQRSLHCLCLLLLPADTCQFILQLLLFGFEARPGRSAGH